MPRLQEAPAPAKPVVGPKRGSTVRACPSKKPTQPGYASFPPRPLARRLCAGEDPAPGVLLVQRLRQGRLRRPGRLSNYNPRACAPRPPVPPVAAAAALRCLTPAPGFPSRQTGVRYPVVVRFDKVNYAGVSTNNYALTEARAACQARKRGFR